MFILNLSASDVDFFSCCRYYMNLCQRVYEGPTGCSDRASICKKSQNGAVQVLGLVHTQKLNVTGTIILLNFCQ